MDRSNQNIEYYLEKYIWKRYVRNDTGTLSKDFHLNGPVSQTCKNSENYLQESRKGLSNMFKCESGLLRKHGNGVAIINVYFRNK